MAAGTYGGATFGFPWGLGGGLYFDNRGRIYPQLYGGSPGWSLSAGYTPDLEGLLTGPSVSASAGVGSVRFNAAGSGGASGIGFGTPGVGVTHGYGPYELSDDFSRPWAKSYVRDSAALAGVPGRNNVFEYGFPELAHGRATARSVFESGAPPIPFSMLHMVGGLPGLITESGLSDASNPCAPLPGGLVGLILEYMRDNSRGSN